MIEQIFKQYELEKAASRLKESIRQANFSRYKIQLYYSYHFGLTPVNIPDLNKTHSN